jgi:hypothetical protein
MKIIKELMISSHYLSAIINNDYSGLNEDETQAVKDFLKEQVKGYLVDIAENSENFCKCYINKLYSDCVEIKLVNIKGE